MSKTDDSYPQKVLRRERGNGKRPKLVKILNLFLVEKGLLNIYKWY